MIDVFSTMPTSGEAPGFSDGLTGQGGAVRWQVVSQTLKVRGGSWNTLSLSVEAYLLGTRNAGFAGAGKPGVLTKADGLTYFTEFKIILGGEQMPAEEGQNESN